MIIFDCHYPPEHQHSYPDDWQFGGADGTDPRADTRWKPTTYTYYDADLTVLHVTQTPLCDDQALDEFTIVRGWFDGKASPHWLQVKRPGEKPEMLRWVYDAATDLLSEVKKNV